MKRADGGIPAALERIIQIHPCKLFILIELPYQPTARLLQRRQSSPAKILPRKCLLSRKRWPEIYIRRRDNIARMAIGPHAVNLDERAVLFIGNKKCHRNFPLIGDGLRRFNPARCRVLGTPQIDPEPSRQLDRIGRASFTVGLDLNGKHLQVFRESAPLWFFNPARGGFR